ncbi:MAG: ROK family glucokinase [Actinomycetota bacterium]
MLTLGIDVGGTKIAAGVVDDSGAVLARRKVLTEAGRPEAVVAGIVKVAAELHAAAPGIAAVGVGAAGIVDFRRGVVLFAPNISWRDVPLRSMLAGRLGVPVVVDNDANVAAWGEAFHGAGAGARDQILLTVGTGVGGGFVLGGELYRGAHGAAAEVGHMVVNAGGPVCGCGARGCLEAMASGTAIGRIARERGDDPAAAGVLARASGDLAAITGEMVGDAAVEGDPFAVSVVAEAGGWLGVGIASLVNLLDPDVVVVGGGVATGVGELLLAPARARMRGAVMGDEFRSHPPVVPAMLGDDAGVIGAAALARQVASGRRAPD